MTEIALWDPLLLCGGLLLGLGVGTLTGLFGAGGGFIITPALHVILGVDMSLAVGTSACQVLGASAFTLMHHCSQKIRGMYVALFVGIGVPAGTWCGSGLVRYLKELPPLEFRGTAWNMVDLVLLSTFAVFLFAIAGWMLFDSFVLAPRRGGDAVPAGLLQKWQIPPLYSFGSIPAGKFSIPVLMGLGICMGFLSGLLGIGGGVVMLPALFYLVGQEPKAAALTSTMLIFVSGLFSTFFHAVDGNIHYLLALAMVTGAFAGTRIGTLIQRKIDGGALRKYFAFVVLAAWCMVVWQLGKFLWQA